MVFPLSDSKNEVISVFLQIGKCIYIRLQNVEFQSNVMVIPYCDSLQEANCEMSCDNAVISEISLNPKLKDSEIFNLYQFWMFAIFLVLSWVGQAVIVSIGDTICFELLGIFLLLLLFNFTFIFTCYFHFLLEELS